MLKKIIFSLRTPKATAVLLENETIENTAGLEGSSMSLEKRELGPLIKKDRNTERNLNMRDNQNDDYPEPK